MTVSTLGGGGSVTLTQPTVQAITITPTSDTAGSTSGQYFLLSSPQIQFYFWNNVSSAGLDPKIPGLQGVPVIYSSGASAATIATAITTALQTLPTFFSANISSTNSTLVQVANTSTGVPVSTASAGTSSWTIVTIQPGTGFPGSIVATQEILNITPVADVNLSTANKYFLMSTTTIPYYVWNNVQTTQITSLVAQADSSGSLASKYFVISSTTVTYAVWFYVGGTGNAPTVSTSISTTVPVVFATNSTAAQVATAIATALNGISNGAVFLASVTGSTVTITNVVGGAVLAAPSQSAGSQEIVTVTVSTGDTSGNSASKYFLISNTLVEFSLWNNVFGTTSFSTGPGTPISVTYSANAVSSTILAAIVSSITSNSSMQMVATQNGSAATIYNNYPGAPFIAPAAGTSGYTVTATTVGAAVSGFTLTVTTTGGVGTDPVISGRTGIPVVYTQNASSASVAAAMVTAINGVLGGSSSVLPNTSTVKFVANATGVVLSAPSVGTSANTVIVTQQGTPAKTLSGGPFSVTLFTTPSTANYTYQVEVLLSPTSVQLGASGIAPTSGIEWSFVGNNLKQVSTTADDTFYPATATRVVTGGWKTIQCGPSTPVTVTGWAYSANETYSIAYNYIGYLIS